MSRRQYSVRLHAGFLIKLFSQESAPDSSVLSVGGSVVSLAEPEDSVGGSVGSLVGSVESDVGSVGMMVGGSVGITMGGWVGSVGGSVVPVCSMGLPLSSVSSGVAG